ncbi:hypothetical protein ACVW00_001437 [Marmoricola sp. URHA0025 HA25]
MDPHQATSRAPLSRLLVRLLVLAGAAVVGWLLISGGPAQADDSGKTHPQVSDRTGARPALVPGVEVAPGLVGRTVAAVTTPLREAPEVATRAVDTVTAQAPAPVRQATQQLTQALEPTLAATTTQVADAVDQTAAGIDTTAVDPALQAAGLQATPAAAAQSVPAAHEAARSHGDPAPARHARVALADSQTAVPATVHLTAARPDPVAGAGHPSVPRAPDGPAVPIGSSSSGGGTATVLVGVAILAPALVRRRRVRRGDPLPSGPTYLPGCSPD